MNIRTFVAFLSENLQYNFPKTRGGGGSKAIWNFSEKTSVLVFSFVPYGKVMIETKTDLKVHLFDIPCVACKKCGRMLERERASCSYRSRYIKLELDAGKTSDAGEELHSSSPDALCMS